MGKGSSSGRTSGGGAMAGTSTLSGGVYAGFNEKEQEMLKRWGVTETLSKDEIISSVQNGLGRGTTVEVRLWEFKGNRELNVDVQVGKFQVSGALDFKSKEVQFGLAKFDKDVQGKGIMKKIIKTQLPLYDKLGMTAITTVAGLNRGGYVWARYGFNAPAPTIKIMYEKVRAEAIRLTGNKNILPNNPPDHMAAVAAIRIPRSLLSGARAMLSPSTLRTYFSSLYNDGSGNFRLGKALLMGTEWIGKLNLSRNSVDRKILEAYINQK